MGWVIADSAAATRGVLPCFFLSSKCLVIVYSDGKVDNSPSFSSLSTLAVLDTCLAREGEGVGGLAMGSS